MLAVSNCWSKQKKSRDWLDIAIGYRYRAVTKAERAYDTTTQECLAIVLSTLLVRPCLKTNGISIRKNHESFYWILNLSDTSGSLAWWWQCLLEIGFGILYRAIVEHYTPDALSWLPTEGTNKTLLKHDLPIMFINEIEGSKHDCSTCVLKDTISIFMNAMSERTEFETPTLLEFIEAQSKRVFCQQCTKNIRLSGIKF